MKIPAPRLYSVGWLPLPGGSEEIVNIICQEGARGSVVG
jgi:hypothetical protein